MKMKWSLLAVAAMACLLPAHRPAFGDDDDRVKATFDAVDAVMKPRNPADAARKADPADASSTARKATALRKVTLREAKALRQAGKMRLVQKRGVGELQEDAIDLDDLVCSEFNCDELYVIYDAEGNQIGIAGGWAVSANLETIDQGRLIKRRSLLRQIASARGSKGNRAYPEGCSYYGICNNEYVNALEDAYNAAGDPNYNPNQGINMDSSASLFNMVSEKYQSLQQDPDYFSSTDDRSVRLVPLAKSRELLQAGKIRAKKTRTAAEAAEAIDAGSIACGDYDCSKLYLVCTPGGDVLGVVDAGAVDTSKRTVQRGAVISSKRDLGKIKSAAGAVVAAQRTKRSLHVQPGAKALAKYRINRAGDAQQTADIPVIINIGETCMAGDDSCVPSYDVAGQVANLVGGAMVDDETYDRQLKKRSAAARSARIAVPANRAKRLKRGDDDAPAEPTINVEVQCSSGDCSEMNKMGQDIADDLGGTVTFSNPDPSPSQPADASSSDRSSRAVQGAAKGDATRQLSQKLVTGKFYALVVGINSYKKINKLENAANDAKVVAQVLKEDYGFETTVLLEEQATRDNIMTAINDMRRKLTEDDSFMIYYSGHGEFNKDTGTSYWLPIDADFDDTTKWLDARGVSDQLKLLSARHVLVVADSCFSGTMTRSAGTEMRGNTTRESYLNKLFEKPSRVLIASGGNEPVADGGAKGHSLFAAVLLKALRNPFDKVFTAEELMTRHLKESVAGRTDQTPEYKVIRNSGHDGGDFIFVKKN